MHSHTAKYGINILKLHICKCVYVHRDCMYLFELDHYVFGQLHVLEHPL